MKGCHEDIKEFVMPWEVATLFTPGNPYYLCTSYTQYTSTVSSAEEKLKEIVKHEMGDGQWTKLLLTQILLAYTVQILQ